MSGTSILLTILLVLALFLSRLCSRTLIELLGEGWYAFLLWPGVIVHEVSHLGGAILTLTPVRGFSVFPEDPSGRTRVLGFVRHDEPRNAVAVILVSAAPFIGGALALYALGHWLIPELFGLLPTAGAYRNARTALMGWVPVVAAIREGLRLHPWRVLLFIYLGLAIGAHLAPSDHDLKHTVRGLAALTVVLALLALIQRLFAATAIGLGIAFIWRSLAWLEVRAMPATVSTVTTLGLAAMVAGATLAIKRMGRRALS